MQGFTLTYPNKVGRNTLVSPDLVYGKTTGTFSQHWRLAGVDRKRNTSTGIARVSFAPPSTSPPGTPDDGGLFSSLCRPEKFDEVRGLTFRTKKWEGVSICQLIISEAKDGRVHVLQVFELGERLGDGAFAVVHKAIHRASGKELAVKIVDKTRLRRTRATQVIIC